MTPEQILELESRSPMRTVWGVLLLHKGHALLSDSRYVSPPGKVFGRPHVYLICETCKTLIWDENLTRKEG